MDWFRYVQTIIDEIDSCIKSRDDEALALEKLAQRLGYSEFYMSRKLKEISGMSFKDYLRARKLAFALKDIRDTQKGILDIAIDYGFSSHEAFTRVPSRTPTASRPARTAPRRGPWSCAPRSTRLTATFLV